MSKANWGEPKNEKGPVDLSPGDKFSGREFGRREGARRANARDGVSQRPHNGCAGWGLAKS